jgi:hypothetical protein
MRDLFFGITFILVIVVAPIVGLGWIIYRAVKGSGGDNDSIMGG